MFLLINNGFIIVFKRRLINGGSNNLFKDNDISSNDHGIVLGEAGWGATTSNTITMNNITENTGYGLFLTGGSDNNKIFKNNLISNGEQVKENGVNTWYLSKEGNHWSDYAGLDNGEFGGIAGDGIGDTELLHLDLDLYPFYWGVAHDYLMAGHLPYLCH